MFSGYLVNVKKNQLKYTKNKKPINRSFNAVIKSFVSRLNDNFMTYYVC